MQSRAIRSFLRTHPRGVLVGALTLVMAFTGIFMFLPGRSEAAEYWEGYTPLNGSTTGATMTANTNDPSPGYRVNATTVTISNNTAGGNGITINGSGSVVLYIPAGRTLNVSGAASNGQMGGGAGILLPDNVTLYIRGGGTLNVTGGAGGNGGNGGNGGEGDIRWEPGVYDDWIAGVGGAGGVGGGGAGAGIGTPGGSGGNGGAGGIPATRGPGNTSSSANGGNGQDGSKGNNSNTSGKLYVLDSVTVSATAGGSTDIDGDGGVYGKNAQLEVTNNFYAAGGAGGGGGGSGGSAANIGSGGPGGAGGGGGGAGGRAVYGSGGYHSDWFPTAAGGTGGKGISGLGESGVGTRVGQGGTYISGLIYGGESGKGSATVGTAGGGGNVYVALDARISELVKGNGNIATRSTLTTWTLTYNDGKPDGAPKNVTGMPSPDTQPTYQTSSVPNQYVSSAQPALEGYNFDRWNTSRNNNGTAYSPGGEYKNATGPQTIYAIWNAITYTLILDKNGGQNGQDNIYQKYNTGWYSNSGATTQIGSASSGNQITMPTQQGYIFDGYWTAALGGEQRVNNTGRMVTGTSTTGYTNSTTRLYAHWIPIKYNVRYYQNHTQSDTTVLSTDTDREYGNTTSYKYANAPSRTGYKFLRWGDTWNAGSGYAAGEAYYNLSTTNNATVNRYAIWELVNYDITYNADGRQVEGQLPTGKYTIEEADTKLAAAPVPTGDDANLIFYRWKVTGKEGSGPGFAAGTEYASAEVVGLVDADQKTYGNVTLTAEWIEPQGSMADSEWLIISLGAFTIEKAYWKTSVHTYLNGALSSMDRVELYQGGDRKFTLMDEEVDGEYSYTADSATVPGGYDVYVDGKDTYVDVSFSDNPAPSSIYFYSVQVGTNLDDEPADVDTLVLKKGDDKLSLTPDSPGVYTLTRQVNGINGDQAAEWHIIVDGEDSGETVAFSSGGVGNTAEVNRYTVRVETTLDGEPSDKLGDVTLKAPDGSGKQDIPLAKQSEGVYGLTDFKDKDETVYMILVGGDDTGETASFKSGELPKDIEFYTAKIETYLNGGLADIGDVALTPGIGDALPMLNKGVGLYELVGQMDNAKSYAVSVGGGDIGKAVKFSSENRTAKADYFTVIYTGTGDEDDGSLPPVDAGRYLSGRAATLEGSGTLAWEGHTFAGWQEVGGDQRTYEPGEAFEHITKETVFEAVWTEDGEAEAAWVVSGNSTVHYGRLDEAFAAAKAEEAGVGITLRADCSMGYRAELGLDDSLTIPAGLTLQIEDKGELKSAGLIDNGKGKVAVEDGGMLYNDNIVLSADAVEHLVVSQGGYAASLVTFDANGHGTSPEAIYVPFGEAVPATTPDGLPVDYTFEGWYFEAELLNPWATGSGGGIVTNAVQLYASWSLNHYPVTFDWEGNGPEPRSLTVSVTHGAALLDYAPNVTEAGFTVEGWYPDTNFEESEKYGPPDNDKTVTEEGVKAYAHWTRNDYIVTFDLSGHKDAEPAPEPVTIAFEGKITEPSPAAIAAGYDLTGWYRDEACTDEWDFAADTMPADDLTLHAGWRASTPVTVDFNLNGHGEATPAAIGAMPGTTLNYYAIIPEPYSDEAEYSFGSWYKDKEGVYPWSFTTDKVPPRDMTLWAKWVFDGYTVTFDLNGVREDELTSPSQSFTNIVGQNATVHRPEDPATEGYTFAGWFKDKPCTDEWDFDNDVVNKNMTLYAKWAIGKYDVAFDLKSHGSPQPVKQEDVTFKTPVARPDPAPTDSDYLFLGWYKDQGATKERWSFASDTMPGRDLTLYAGWRSKTAVRMSFNMNRRGEPVPDDQWLEPGEYVTRPEEPHADGYGFGGWYKDKACTGGNEWIFDGEGTATPVPDGGAAIYAKWTAVPYTVSFDLNGPDGVTPAPQPASYSAIYGYIITEPETAPKAFGYTFLGWYRDKAAKSRWIFANDTMPKDDLTLYAGWRNDSSLKVMFDPNLPAGATLLGPAVIGSAWVLPDGLVPEPSPAPEAAGYDFGGWYRDAKCTPGQKWDFAGARVDIPMTLYAKWAVAPCTVYFDTGSKSAEIDLAIVNPGDKLTEPAAPSAPGWDFKGWYMADGYGPWDFSTDTAPAVRQLMLSALWVAEGSIEASFDLNATTQGGFVGDPSALTKPATQWLMPDDWVSEPNATAEGQYVSAWHLDAIGTPDARWDFTNHQVTDSAIKLYAQWLQHIYEVGYELNGHAAADMPYTAVTYGALLTQATPTADTGWAFTAWYGDMSLKKPWDFATHTMPARNVTLYAGWHSDKAYEVTFDVNGHGKAPDTAWVEPGAPWLDEPEPSVTEEGWTFRGWYKDAVCSEGQKWVFETDTVTAPMTLYAKWTLNQYYISFDTGGFGKPAPAAVKAGFGARIPAPPQPYQDGYVFGGWYTDELCKSGRWNFMEHTVPSKDMTLYAKWTIGGFTASFDMKGHGSPAPAPQSVVFGARIAEPAQPSETGCIFGGWYTDAACSPGAEWDFDTDTMPGHDQTLYAKWSFIPYKVYFSLNGHGAPAPAAMTVQYGGKIPTPTQPSDKGWTFGGWFTDAACSPGAEWDFATSTMPLSDLTLYAKWTEKIGGGSGSNDDKDKDEDNDKDNDSDSGKDSGKSKDNSGSGSSGGDNAGGSGANTGGATGDGTGGIADGGIGGVSGDGDAYGENGADNIGGDESEWHTNGGNAAAGEDDNGRGSQEDMSFANILLMAAGIAIAVFMALNARRRRYQRWLLPVVVALGALGAILYLAIEGIHGAWALINSHTIYFAIILAAQIAATIIARRS